MAWVYVLGGVPGFVGSGRGGAKMKAITLKTVDKMAKESCGCRECIGLTPYNSDSGCCYDATFDAARTALVEAVSICENTWRSIEHDARRQNLISHGCEACAEAILCHIGNEVGGGE